MCTRPADEKAERRAAAPFRTPFGDGVLTVDHGRLACVDLPHTGEGATAAVWGGVAEPGLEPTPEDEAALRRWGQELEAYFAGERLSWTADEIGLDLLPVGDFARAVYRELLAVPPGVTVSYGALAEMAGFPRAARAVGTAMATNPIPIVIPCHRVVRSDGALGNYGDDPAWKPCLLAHEREHAPGGRGGT